MEHLSFDACQCEDRQVHDHDDQLTEQQRTSCLLGRQEDLIESLFPCQLAPRDFLGMGESAYAVLDDHDGTVNDDAEVQGSQTHQVGTDLLLDHPGEGEEHRQRDHHGSQNGRPHVPEEQEQDGNHQNGAFKKVLLDGVDGLVDQDCPVINRYRMHALGQIAVDLDHLLVDGLRHLAAVFADQHEDGPKNHLTPVVGRRTGTELSTDLHDSDVTDADWNTALVSQDDVADVLHRTNLAGRPNEVLLAAALNVACADVGIVSLKRADKIDQGQAIGRELDGIWRNVVLLGEATDRVDFGDARHVTQLWLDDPVLDFAQIGRRIGIPIRLLGAVLRLDRPLVDLPQTGGDRTDGRRDTLRQTVASALDTLVDQLPCKVDVRAILEHNGHLRQPVP